MASEEERLRAELDVIEHARRVDLAERELYEAVWEHAARRRLTLAESAALLNTSRATLARRLAARPGQGSPKATRRA